MTPELTPTAKQQVLDWVRKSKAKQKLYWFLAWMSISIGISDHIAWRDISPIEGIFIIIGILLLTP